MIDFFLVQVLPWLFEMIELVMDDLSSWLPPENLKRSTFWGIELSVSWLLNVIDVDCLFLAPIVVLWADEFKLDSATERLRIYKLAAD